MCCMLKSVNHVLKKCVRCNTHVLRQNIILVCLEGQWILCEIYTLQIQINKLVKFERTDYGCRGLNRMQMIRHALYAVRSLLSFHCY